MDKRLKEIEDELEALPEYELAIKVSTPDGEDFLIGQARKDFIREQAEARAARELVDEENDTITNGRIAALDKEIDTLTPIIAKIGRGEVPTAIEIRQALQAIGTFVLPQIVAAREQERAQLWQG